MQKNSFISLLEQISQLNKNSVEIITKLNDVVSSNNNSVTVTLQQEDGRLSTYEMPTVGYLKKEIDIANSNIKKLAGLEGDNSVVVIDNNNISRKIQSVDLNREPAEISSLNLVSSFTQTNNWFFESLINPSLAVVINLDGQINEFVRKIISRRYIIKFEKDSENNYTSNGLASLQSFQTSFLNKNTFTITEFQNWLNNPTNLGVIDKNVSNLITDEQLFDLNYKEINYKGFFSVLKIERDRLNNKVWYHFNTLNYYSRDASTKTISIGDILSITKDKSYTKYKVIEINTASSLFKVNLERIEGYDPIPVGTSVLEYYSTLQSQNNVKITIGFDEYNVVFIKPINIENGIIGSTWSKGMAFYSNDLVLDTDNSVNMVDFYIDSVYDYGVLLKDLVAKKIPSKVGLKPNSPIMVSDNFKVVQINKHLTNTKDSNTLKKLQSQKETAKSKLEQINQAIIEKNKELNTKKYKSVAEKSKSQNELDKLIKRQESETKLYSSYVNQIVNSKIETNVDPKFRIRGFWDIPDAIFKQGYKTQEVIGFEIQYRYGSKLGNDNTIEGYDIKRSVVELNSQNQERQQYKKTTGYFSEWVSLKTDIRKRTYNEDNDTWYWDIEDVSNADTPNINQLDIAIQRSEKVDVRIRSISEVGYPETILYSDWSDIMTIEFPENLNDVLGENDFILKEATQEEMRVSFETELSSKGIIKHSSDSFYSNETYYAHKDSSIATSFKDSFGNTILLYDYLKMLTDKISSLEEIVKRAKGELKVSLFKGVDETEISNNSIINIVINCEDYMNATGSTFSTKTIENNVYLIQDYYIKIANIATQSPLGLLCDKTLLEINEGITNSNPTIISSDGRLYKQVDNQFVWLLDKVDDDYIYSGSSYDNSTYILGSDNRILGDFYNNNLLLGDNPDLWYSSSISGSKVFGATIHPYINSQSSGIFDIQDKNSTGIHILDANSDIIIPLNIYFKPDMSNIDDTISITTKNTPYVRKKRLRLKLEDENSIRAFVFTVNFTLIRHNQFIVKNVSNSYNIK